MQLLLKMPSAEKSEYLSFRETTKRLLAVVGLWPSQELNSLYRLLPYTQIFLSLGIVIATSRFVQVNFTSVRLVTSGMSIMTSFLSVILKISCMNINREKLMELHRMLDEHFLTLLGDPQLERIVLEGIRPFRQLSLVLVGLASVACIIFIITPPVSIIQQYRQHIQPIKYSLVFPGIYPWNISPNGLLYKIHFLYETAANMTLLCITAGVDSLFTLYVFQIIGQFREMSHRIRFSKDDYKLVIRQCVQQHRIIMKSRDILETIYGPVFIWIMLTNAVILCSLIFQVSQMQSISVFRGTLLATYISLKIIQTFMYTWSASQLTAESENYRQAIYFSNWCSKKCIRASIAIMLAQKPLTLTACKFSTVSIDIFVMVLNTTASYFFLLQAIS